MSKLALDPVLDRFIRAMPKVELHVHLEGSIRPRTLLELARRHAVDLPAADVEGLRAWYEFRDFDHFVEVYLTSAGCLREPVDIERVTEDFLEGQAEQNVLYTEATYTPSTQRTLAGIPLDEQLDAIDGARRAARRRHGVELALTIDYPRHFEPDAFVEVAGWAAANRERGIAALGLGGPEVGHPPEPFAEAFAVARRGGLHSAPHAGETAGAESVWGALRALRAERIGHGVRCLEDPELVEELRRRRIPLEVCPTSNVRLGVAPSLATHPLPRLLEAGLTVTLNSDDPPMFGTTLTDEYRRCAATFGWDADPLEELVRTAARAAFLEPAAKAALEERVEEEFRVLRERLGLPSSARRRP